MSVRVKRVVSGDTLILVDKPAAGASAEGADSAGRQLTLAYVSAPPMSQVAGYEAREFLRQLLLAKPVRSTELYEHNGHAFGDVSAPIFKSLVQHVLANGWAELRGDYLSKPGARALQPQLEAAQADAQQRQVGIWSGKYSTRSFVVDTVPADVYGSNRRVPAIVESVLAGDRIVLRALLSDTTHFVGVASLAGVRTANPQASKHAADILSTRLLQRQQVRALFVAPAPFNEDIPLVTLLHPQGDIAMVLVGAGLAEVPNHPQVGTERLLALRAAQHDAEQKGVGIWRAAAQARQEHRDAYGQVGESRVVKIISADTLVIEPGMKTVQLSSVRAPRRSEQIGDAPPGYFVDSAREFTRKLLIGQTVRVQTDGETADGRALVTVIYGPQFSNNAALSIIRAGWATATHHRRDDLARSPFYDELRAAQTDAEEAKRGIFQATTAQSRKPTAKNDSTHVVYASESVVRARGYLATLERRPRVPAVVDQVVAAGRLRLLVPSENCALMAVLDGVRVPRTSEPMGEEAAAYVLREWNQRDVQVSVRSVDKTGAFVAEVWLKSRELARELLARGFASVHAGSANASGLRAEYDEIEERAKAAREGIWANYMPPVEDLTVEDDVAESGEAAEVTYRDAVLAHATPDQVFVRYDNAKFVEQQRALQGFFTAAANTAARTFAKRPKRRDLVATAAKYERAVITNVARHDPSLFEIELIDTGEQRSAKLAELLPLPAQFAAAPGLASPVTLKYVHRPVSLYTKKYLEFFTPLLNKPVVVAGGVLYTPDSTGVVDSLNYRIIATGLASVPVADSTGADAYLEAQEKVKDARRGMWEYGDPREDDDM